jgi:hypothetical protein
LGVAYGIGYALAAKLHFQLLSLDFRISVKTNATRIAALVEASYLKIIIGGTKMLI